MSAFSITFAYTETKSPRSKLDPAVSTRMADANPANVIVLCVAPGLVDLVGAGADFKAQNAPIAWIMFGGRVGKLVVVNMDVVMVEPVPSFFSKSRKRSSR